MTFVQELFQVSVGVEAPPLTLLDQDGKTFSLAKLKGKKAVVLYFYPADDTPGCTKQVELCSVKPFTPSGRL